MEIEAEITNIQSHVDKGNYHAGINLAISAMNACRKEHDQAGVDTFIQLIKKIVDTIDSEFGSSKPS